MNHKIKDHRIIAVLNRLKNDDMSKIPSISSIAKSVNLSMSRFQHLFKGETGISFTGYVRNLRLKKAQILLTTTHLLVKEIRAKVGEKNEFYFSHTFKKEFGISPQKYRENHRNLK